MLCTISVDSHLTLALDSKSIQFVCDMLLLYQYFYINIYRFS